MGKIPDYEKLHLPVAENFCANQQIAIPHQVLLVPRKNIQKIIDAFVKIKKNTEELKRVK